MIRFTCEHCGRQLSVAETHAGKRGRCPRCKQSVRVPAGEEAAPEAGTQPAAQKKAAERSARDLALLDWAEKPAAEEAAAPPEDEPADAGAETEPDGSDDEEDEGPPRFSDMFLYPASLNGLVQIGIFTVGLWLVGSFGAILGAAQHYGGILALALQVIVFGYILFYWGYCIFDSSRGGRRAPAISTAHTPDLRDMISQWGLLIASIAICLWPVGLYYGFTERVDQPLLVLAGVGAFFLPMALLTATLFDGIGALNPLLIVRSIVVTLPAYLVLLYKLFVVVVALALLRWSGWRVCIPNFFFVAARLYVWLIAAYLIGSFYRKNAARLDWGL